ncbi:MAG: hypothetical protein EOP33_00420 [Rickettsiaceae bacterium]|nr:MAG: hypothetical protein EOP33_00420 [Rickettsiaceae bacterium]
MKKIIIICFLCANFCSCGFRPLLSNSTDKNILSSIEIVSDNSIEAAELNYHLNTLLPKSRENNKYRLDIHISSNIEPSIVQKNSNILSENVNQNISYSLVDINSGIILLADQFSQYASYDSTYDPYRSNTELDNTKVNLARYGAEEIRRRLILYLKNIIEVN